MDEAQLAWLCCQQTTLGIDSLRLSTLAAAPNAATTFFLDSTRCIGRGRHLVTTLAASQMRSLARHVDATMSYELVAILAPIIIKKVMRRLKRSRILQSF